MKVFFGVVSPYLLVSMYQVVSIFFVNPKNNDRFIELTLIYCFLGFVGFVFFTFIPVKHKIVTMTLIGVVYVPFTALLLTYYSYFFYETFFNTPLGGVLLKQAYGH